MPMSLLLELRHVYKHYVVPGTDTPDVLRDVSLRLNEGETLAITGPSGSGKSTLLNVIGTLDRPSLGSVFLDGRELTESRERALASVRNRVIGFVFQLHHLLPQCTVLENVLVPALAGGSILGVRRKADRARDLLQRIGLADRASYRPGQLSGGERQRVAVARALINHPKLLLADEPTGSLDREAADSMADLLMEINREEGTALIVVTHSASLAERMQRVYGLRDGKLWPGKGAE
jgi:ABC-type lipoprotein export system ATPase subunit